MNNVHKFLHNDAKDLGSVWITLFFLGGVGFGSDDVIELDPQLLQEIAVIPDCSE